MIILDDDFNYETEPTEECSVNNKWSSSIPVIAKAPTPVVASSAMANAQPVLPIPPSMHSHTTAPFGMNYMQASTTAPICWNLECDTYCWD